METEIQDAIQRLGVATSNNAYDKITVFSTYWGSDDTGADKDSSLFIETIRKLHNVDAYKYILSQEHTDMKLSRDVFNALPSGTLPSRRLFIFHYAGHSIAGTLFTPKSDQKFGTGPEINPSRLSKDLKAEASSQAGLDILFILDTSCSSNSIQGVKAKGARVEFVVGGPRKDLNNPRTALDGGTFTQHWCAAFNKLLDTRNPFVSEDINKIFNPDSGYYSRKFSLFVLREGWDLPITFSSYNNTIEPSLPSDPTVITVFYFKENSDSPSVKQLIEYLNNAPVPITVLKTVPIQFTYLSGTLLLLSMPALLQELLAGSRVAIMLEDE